MTSPATTSLRKLPAPAETGVPPTALAPMQDITTRAFMSVLHEYASPDYYFTEYFRVHAHSRLEKHILESITQSRSYFDPEFLSFIEWLPPFFIPCRYVFGLHAIINVDAATEFKALSFLS